MAKALEAQGLRVWFDEFTLVLGDSLRRSIDHGLANADFGVVILSPSFFAKEWPQKELDGLVSREQDGIKVILPVWHQLKRADVLVHSPLLADRLAVSSDIGIDSIVSKLLEAMRRKPLDAVKEPPDDRQQQLPKHDDAAALSLAEELYLLCANPTDGDVPQGLCRCGIQVAMLAELALMGRVNISADGRQIMVVDRTPLANKVLDCSLVKITALLTAGQYNACDLCDIQLVKQALIDKRILGRRVDSVLVFWTVEKYPITQPSVRDELVRKMTSLSIGSTLLGNRGAVLLGLASLFGPPNDIPVAAWDRFRQRAETSDFARLMMKELSELLEWANMQDAPSNLCIN